MLYPWFGLLKFVPCFTHGIAIDSIPYGHGIRNDHRLCSYHPCPDHKTIQTVVTREVYVHIQMASVTPQNTDGATGLRSAYGSVKYNSNENFEEIRNFRCF